jgi:hypothetical protein
MNELHELLRIIDEALVPGSGLDIERAQDLLARSRDALSDLHGLFRVELDLVEAEFNLAGAEEESRRVRGEIQLLEITLRGVEDAVLHDHPDSHLAGVIRLRRQS